LSLEVRTRLHPALGEFETILGRTSDISSHGFYCEIAERVSVGTRFEFRIILPRQGTESCQAFVDGLARVVRVEQRVGAGAHAGVGVFIERYRIASVPDTER